MKRTSEVIFETVFEAVSLCVRKVELFQAFGEPGTF